RSDRPEDFNLVHCFNLKWFLAEKKSGLDEARNVPVRVDWLEVGPTTERELSFPSQPSQPFECGSLLRTVNQRTALNFAIARITHLNSCQSISNRFCQRPRMLAGHQHSPNSCAFLSSLDRHLAHHFFCQQIENGCPGRNIRP